MSNQSIQSNQSNQSDIKKKKQKFQPQQPKRIFDFSQQFYSNLSIVRIIDDFGIPIDINFENDNNENSDTNESVNNQNAKSLRISLDFEESLSNSNDSINSNQKRTTEFRCHTCNTDFDTNELQREHYDSEFHRCNLKLKAAKVPTISFEEFNQLTNSGEFGLDENSNSDEDTDSLDDKLLKESVVEEDKREKTDQLVADLKQKASLQEQKEIQKQQSRKLNKRLPYTSFETVDDKHVRIQTSILSAMNDNENFDEYDDSQAKSKHLLHAFRQLNRNVLRVAVILCQGGRFAAALFDNEKCVKHQAYVRYTVRAKQGGSQLTKDAKGKSIKSAGSSLRRENAKRLAEDIAKTLEKWTHDLNNCDLIYVHAPGDNKKYFLPQLYTKDKRIKSIPMVVKRPTFAEVRRVHFHLCIVSIVDKPLIKNENQIVDEKIELNEIEEEKTNSKIVSNPLLKAIENCDINQIQSLIGNEIVEFSKLPYLKDLNEKQLFAMQSMELHLPPIFLAVVVYESIFEKDRKAALIVDEKTDFYAINKTNDSILPCISIESKNKTKNECEKMLNLMFDLVKLNRFNVNAIAPIWRSRTALFYALACDDLEMFEKLLSIGADLSIRDAIGRKAMDMCSSNEIRRQIRRLAFEKPDLTDWESANINPLSDEEEKQRIEKELKAQIELEKKQSIQQEKRAARKEKEKINAEKRRVLKQEKDKIIAQQKKSKKSMSEREKRALAAERRFQGVPKCAKDDCDESLPLVPFSYKSVLICSTVVVCVAIVAHVLRQHRR